MQIFDTFATTIQVIITLLFYFNINISNNNNELIHSDMDHQNCARKNNLDPPVFTIKPEGPPHDIRYKATVVIDGKSFESPTSFNTIKEAEQAAAKFVDMFQKVNHLCLKLSNLFKCTFMFVFYPH